MKGPIGFGRLVNMFMNIIMGLCISLVIFLSAGIPFTPEILIEAWFASFVIGYTAGDLGPVVSWGIGLSRILHIKNAVGSYLISSIVSGVYFGVIILFGNALINNLPAAGWSAVFGFFLDFLGIVLVAAIILVLIFSKPSQMLATAISGFDPSKLPPTAGHEPAPANHE